MTKSILSIIFVSLFATTALLAYSIDPDEMATPSTTSIRLQSTQMKSAIS